MPSRSSRPIRPLSVVASCLLLLVSGVTLHADYKESYRKGIAAVDARQWADVARYMQEAIAEQPREGDRVKIYGNRWEPYIPHYYLGLARREIRDCAGAVSAWKTSEQQGFIKTQSGEFATLQRGLRTCEAQLAASSGSVKPEPSKPSPAKPEPPKPEPPKPSPAKPEPAKPEPAKPEPPKPTTVKPEPAKPPPAGTTTVVPVLPSAEGEAARRALDGHLAAVRSFVDNRRYDEARAAAARARALNLDAGRVEAAIRQIDTAEARDQLRAAIDARQWADAQRLITRLEDLGVRDGTLDELKAAVARGTAATGFERSALSAFYKGDYRQALTQLGAIPGIDAQPPPRVYFYMACSEAALALLEGSGGAPRMERARTLFAKARPHENDFRLDRQFISPRLLRELEKNPR